MFFYGVVKRYQLNCLISWLETISLDTAPISSLSYRLILQASARYKMLVLEEQRYIHEDLERLEQGIADRIREDPKHVSSPNMWLHFFCG